MATVSLQGMRFYGYHGVYPEEGRIGTWFEVDVSVDFEWPEDVTRIGINYEDIFTITKEVMQVRKPLLEELIEEIIKKLRAHFTGLGDIKVRLKKIAPPLGGEVKYAIVEHIDRAQ